MRDFDDRVIIWLILRNFTECSGTHNRNEIQ